MWTRRAINLISSRIRVADWGTGTIDVKKDGEQRLHKMHWRRKKFDKLLKRKCCTECCEMLICQCDKYDLD
jgi:hypothetical protein